MGEVLRFDGGRAKRVPAPLPVVLVRAGAVFWLACSAAWWRWVMTGR